MHHRRKHAFRSFRLIPSAKISTTRTQTNKAVKSKKKTRARFIGEYQIHDTKPLINCVHIYMKYEPVTQRYSTFSLDLYFQCRHAFASSHVYERIFSLFETLVCANGSLFSLPWPLLVYRKKTLILKKILHEANSL